MPAPNGATCKLCGSAITTPAGVAWSTETRRRLHVVCADSALEEANKRLLELAKIISEAETFSKARELLITALQKELRGAQALRSFAPAPAGRGRPPAPPSNAGAMPPQLATPAPKPAPVPPPTPKKEEPKLERFSLLELD